ncbi:leucine-rich repeat-containing protein 74A-like isoform X2 [Dendronephthya gigantea]|uniref:leucine-rich repeat-containing protein 74A-like isoform X2 n=1 Tax=Dendronephthya gigantea TaxID=151771 RepID=UPI00106A684B|nr:leucine-rich repeat-containing protein 74A-like isoform X2 [Dendronephthya gigantea]
MRKSKKSSPGNFSVARSRKVTSDSKVRPFTSKGPGRNTLSSSVDTKQLITRPKTSQALLRNRTSETTDIEEQNVTQNESQINDNSRKLDNIEANVKRNDRSSSSSAIRLHAPRDRSISFGSGSDSSVTGKRSEYSKPKDSKVNIKQSKSSIRPHTTAGPSNFNPVQRKVAWQSDKDLIDTLSDDDDDPRNQGQKVETLRDSFQSPMISIEDSGSEYETDLETERPTAPKQYDTSGKYTYLKVCKQEDVLPVSSLQAKFEEKVMEIKHRSLGSKGTLPLAKSLLKNIYVEKLDLSDNGIEDIGASLIASMLGDNCYITQLDLSENSIGADGGIVLAEMLMRNQILRKLTLRSNHLTDRVARRFAESLRENRTLWHLDLSHNEIGEQGGVFLGAGLAINYGLKHLDLSWNCLRGKGGVALAQAMKTNDSLTTLNLSWNGVSFLGCVALGKFLRRNENLKELDLRNNRIGYLGAQRICPGIAKNTSLETIKLGLNPLGDDGVVALLKAVKINKNLKILNLENIPVSLNAFREIQQLEKNRAIKIITGGLGSFRKPEQMPHQMAILLDFIKVNRLRLVDWFFRFDKDRSGDISREEFKVGLKEIGLKMTQKQLDTLIEYLDVDNNGKIEYSELLIGRDHTLREQRDLRMAQQKLRNVEDMRARLPTLAGFEPD